MEAPPAQRAQGTMKNLRDSHGWFPLVIKHGNWNSTMYIRLYVFIIFSGFSHCIIFAMNDSPFWGRPQYTLFWQIHVPMRLLHVIIYIYIFICIIDCSYTFRHAAKFACQDLTVSQQILHTSKQFNAGVVHIEEHLSICIDKLSYPTVNGTIKRNHQTMGLSQVLELSLPAQPRNVRCTPLSK